MERKTITIRQRATDWIAYLEENASVWATGRNPTEAVGNLIFNNPEAFNIRLA